MSHQLFLARQPILNAEKEIFGYELFYRDESETVPESSPRFTTSSVLVNLLNQIGLRKGIGDATAFVNVNSDILLTDILQNLPKDAFVFELSEELVMTHREIEAIAELHQLGYTFALDNVNLSEEYYKNFVDVFPYVTYAKFDTMMTDIERLEGELKHYEKFKLIAQKVEFTEVYDTYKELGFDYFQGYFFAKPSLIQQNRIDPKHLGVIHLFNMLQEETPVSELADIFQKHNELSMQLLQFANSTGIVKDKKTSSIREVIEAMGPKQLQQWLMMIIYSKSGKSIDNEKSHHSLLIQKRIDLMLALLELVHPNDMHGMTEKIRFLSFMSLLESVFNVPLATVFENFNVSDDIREALETHTGKLGHIFTLALCIEKADFAAAQILLKPLHLSVDDVVTVIDDYLYS